MGKILFTQENEKGSLNFIAGTVTSVREGTGKAAGKVRNILMDLSVYNAESKTNEKACIDIALWDNEKEPENKRKQLATRSKNAKMEAGTFAMFTCGSITEKTAKDGVRQMSAIAFNFDYGMRRSVEVDNEKGLFTNEIICGTIRRLNLEGDHPYIVIPVDRYKDGEKSTDWISVFLKADDENAKKYMQVGTSIACLTSEVHEKLNEGYDKPTLASGMFTYVLAQAMK